MRYASDLRTGRINPRKFEFGLSANVEALDLPTFVEKYLLSGVDLKSALANLEPPFAQYGALKKELARYMQLAQQDDGKKLPYPRGILFSGTVYDGLPRLANLLRLLGDLPDNVAIPEGPGRYEGALVEAVKQFQQRHGLRPDGYLNVATLDELNVPLSDRIQKIRLGMERLRWTHYDTTQPGILVNLPGYRLYAHNAGAKLDFAMTVEVGDEYDHTPLLEAKIEYLVFRPYWDVPFDIQRDEVVPNIRDDPKYLADTHFEVITQDGKLVTDDKVSEPVLQQIHSGKLRVRQKPGPDNSLGLVKFIFPNRYSVYLHDVPNWGYHFDSPDRAVSHGCVHLKEPAKLAAWALRDQPEWTPERIQQEMQGGQDNLRVNLSKPLTVHIVYMTAVVREDGKMYIFRDVYGYDAELQDALAKGHLYLR